MGADILSQFCTWVDAAYGVQPGIKRHNGSGMLFGYGMVHCNYIKQKLNTKSSTESKLVGISDYLPYNIWTCLFMGAQGYSIKQNILFQDNQSEINVEKNGNKSCTENYRRIDIHYLFVKDQVQSNSMSITYCSTYHTISYFFTKSLQGDLFVKMCEVIMGWKHIDTIHMGPTSTKECVGNAVEVK